MDVSCPESQTLSATGTEGRQISLGPFLGPQPATLEDFGGQARTEEPEAGNEANCGKTKESSGFTVFSAEKSERCREYPQGDSNLPNKLLEKRSFPMMAAQNPAHFLPFLAPSTPNCNKSSQPGRRCRKRSVRASWP